MKYLFAVNPASGKGKTKKRMNKLLARLEADRVEYVLYETQPYHYADDLRKIIIAEQPTHVFAVGGDGTAHEVLNAVVGLDVIFGVIPFGSGNDFARVLKLPRKIDAVYDMIKQNRTSRIDVGQFGPNRYFLNYLSLGIDVAIVKEAEKYKTLGKFSYLLAVFKVLVAYKVTRMHINDFNDDAFLAAIHNGKYYGGGMKINPEAIVDDGLLNLVVVKKIPKLKFTLFFPTVIKGSHIRLKQIVVTETTTDYQINITEPTMIGVDGEFYYYSEPFVVTTLKAGVEILVW